MNKNEITEETITAVLRNHPLIGELARSAEEREELRLKRIEGSKRLRELQEEKKRLLPRLRDDINMKKARFEEAQEEARKAQREYGDAERFLMSETFRMDREIAEVASFLRKTAPDYLREKIERLMEQREIVRTGSKSNGEIVAEMQRIEEEIQEIQKRLLEPEPEVN